MPVQIKPSRRGTQEQAEPTDRNPSVQPLIPPSRRQSQHQSQQQPARDGGLTASEMEVGQLVSITRAFSMTNNHGCVDSNLVGDLNSELDA